MTTCSCKNNTDVQFSYAILPKVVQLPVFGQKLRAEGFVCTISLTVNTDDDFGYYVIGASNTVGRTTKEIKIVPKGVFVFRMSLSVFTVC